MVLLLISDRGGEAAGVRDILARTQGALSEDSDFTNETVQLFARVADRIRRFVQYLGRVCINRPVK